MLCRSVNAGDVVLAFAYFRMSFAVYDGEVHFLSLYVYPIIPGNKVVINFVGRANMFIQRS